MGVYHIGNIITKRNLINTADNDLVLFKLKPKFEPSVLEEWKERVQTLVGVVPGMPVAPQSTRIIVNNSAGLKYIDVGSPLPITAVKAKGFNVSLVAVLEKPDDALVYAEHPAHEA